MRRKTLPCTEKEEEEEEDIWVIPRQKSQGPIDDPSQMFPKRLLKISQCVLMTQTQF